MAKRRCGTCKYFEDRGIAGSGWCTHPARQEIQFMVLVRKSELACRNFMDQALWEPAEDAADVTDLADAVVPAPNDVAADFAPDVAMEASAQASATKPVNDHTDKIESITFSVSPPSREPRPSTRHVSFGADRFPSPAAESGSEVREIQRRRREQHVQRQHGTARLLPDAGDSLERLGATNTEPERDDTADLDRPRNMPLPSRHAEPSDDAERSHLVRPRTVERPPLSPPQPRSEGLAIKADGSVDTAAAMPGKSAQQPLRQHMGVSDGHTEPFEVVSVPPSIEQPRVSAPSVSRRHATRPTPGPDTPRRRDSERPGARAADLRDGTASATWHAVQATDIDLVPLKIDPIDDDQTLAETPRCCATCRDFVPEGDGSRGRCRNPYALVQPRMVKSDELACRSSIGVWWLPRDDIWLERAESAKVQAPEPMLGPLSSAAIDRTGFGAQRRGEF